MFGEPDIPTIEVARKRVKRRNKVFLLLSSIFLFFLFLAIYNIIDIENLTFTHPLFRNWLLYTLISFIVLTLLARKMLDLLQMRWGNLEKREDKERIGGFTVGKIKNYTQKIADEMDIGGEKVQVCTMDSTVPNAFGLLWRNLICLDESWLRLLDEEELKALISHELYHLKLKRTRPMFGHPHMMRFVFIVEVLLVMAIITFNGLFQSYTEIVISIFVFQWINTFFFIAPMKSSRAEEHLCDWSALRYTGVEGALNLMLKLGQRYEAIQVIHEAIKEKKKEYSIPLRDYSELQKRIDQNLERDKMTEQGIKETVYRTIENMADEEGWRAPLINLPSLGLDRLSRATKKHKIDWLQYDDHIRDFKLDKKEAKRFVQDIRGDDKSFLFDAPIDSHRDSHGTHPTIKQRVLFLWKNYKLRSGSR